MKKIFLLTVLGLLGWFGAQAQIVYEDFEGGAKLAWTAANGTYNGAIPNPAPDAVNMSSTVGSYTKAAGSSYSLFWVTGLPPQDLSQYNRFKLKVWCSTATPVLLKFEGTGPAIEKTATMTTANAWNELTFDMSKGEAYTGLTRIIIFFDPGTDASDYTYYFDDLEAVKNENIIEDFETPSGITWTSLNGAYNGVVANPAANQVDGSANVGSFANAPAFDYNFAFGTLSAPLDLSVYNQFKVSLRAPKATQMLFKLEGGGQSIEKVKNIAVSNQWQEYTFDFSAAKADTALNKILIVFSPGVLGSSDTFYVDNIKALPQGECVGYTPDPDIIDDYDCNRNAVYGVGWDSIQVVKNPDMNVDNPSFRVGEWNRPAGSGTEYAALVFDYENPIDLSEKYIFGLKMWAPKKGTLLFKIEGSTTNGPKEIPVQVTETGKWVDYSVDFSSQVGKGHTRFVLFFNAGVNGEPGEVYYIDDVKLTKPSSKVLEDFQGAIHLGWQPLNQDNTLHGNFSAPTDNPNPTGENTSTQVGCYAKGSAPLSTLQGIALNNFDLSVLTQFNIDVYSPANALGKIVRMQLNSTTQGNKSVDAKITKPGQWETLGFDFSAYTSITDFAEVRLIFDPGTAAPGESWCVDNLSQGLTTVDPCADVVPDPLIIEDFECQRNYTTIFYGASDLAAVNNPHPTTDNASTKVGEYKDPAGAGTEFAGIGFQLPASPDLSLYNQLEVQVYSPFDNVPFLFKLQNGANIEIYDTLPAANKWYTFSLDFSKSVGTAANQLVIFFNVLSATGGGTYYVDNIRWRRAGYNGCVDDNEAASSTINNFTYFNNNPYDGQTVGIVDNPVKTGINTSDKVAKYVQSAGAPIFSGAYAQLDANIDFKGNKQIKAKVLMDHIGLFTMKVEVFGNLYPPVEIDVPNTKVGEWEELTFNFATVADDAKYPRLTMLVDKGGVGTGSDVVTYIDDIVIGTGECGIVPVFTPHAPEAMVVSPNPVTNVLRVDNFPDVSRIEVFNTFGQRVATLNTSGNSRTEIQVGNYAPGVYALTGFNRQGKPIGYAKFVKQ